MPRRLPAKTSDDLIAEGRDPVAAKLGERIKELRIARNKTIEDVAAAAQISSRYLWRVEDGRQNLSLRNVARIATALPVSLSVLFRGVPTYDGPLENRIAKLES